MSTSSMLPWEWPRSWWNTLSLLQSLQLITFFHDLGRLPGLDAIRTCPPFSPRCFKISKSHIEVTVLKLAPRQIVFTSELRIAKFSNWCSLPEWSKWMCCVATACTVLQWNPRSPEKLASHTAPGLCPWSWPRPSPVQPRCLLDLAWSSAEAIE